MKSFLLKIVTGFGVGLGFTIALVLVLYFGIEMLMDRMIGESYTQTEEILEDSSFGFKEFDEDSGIVIKTHRERPIDNGIEILAKIENTGEDTWSSINVEAELFDSNGDFVDECSEYISGKLRPGEVQNVKIKCGGCDNYKMHTYATYTLDVVSASSY